MIVPAEQKLFLLCVRARRRWHGWPNTDAEEGLVNRLTKRVRLPGRVLVFAPTGGFRALARKLRSIADVTVHHPRSPEITRWHPRP